MPTRGSHLPQKPRAALAPARFTGGPRLPPDQIPVWPPQGTPRRQRTGAAAALGSGFRHVHPRAPGGRAHLAADRCPAQPGSLRGITADKHTLHRAHPEGRGGQAAAGALAPAPAPSREPERAPRLPGDGAILSRCASVAAGGGRRARRWRGRGCPGALPRMLQVQR